jgi:hypothetical protein
VTVALGRSPMKPCKHAANFEMILRFLEELSRMEEAVK